ncbi:hypothetical protein P7K49_009770 [Saguinus oedipus]|uniref:Uncharacterized protein n=1 Tax=Saguinus oedipus TaxID=9490 RepID=A0ABQ9VKW3_SAGOE|nr:hypothetical protein P7K49_009770 [Saguinus oedipus]
MARRAQRGAGKKASGHKGERAGSGALTGRKGEAEALEVDGGRQDRAWSIWSAAHVRAAVRRYLPWALVASMLAGSLLKELSPLPESYLSNKRNPEPAHSAVVDESLEGRSSSQP